MKKEDTKNFIKGGIYGVVDEAISMIPGPNLVWAFVKSGKASLESNSYVRTNELLAFFQENSEVFFKESLLNDENFITGLGLTYESYLRQRSNLKRRIIQEVFKGFTQIDNKEDFEIERMYRTIELISLDSIKYLVFLTKEIIPNQNQAIASSPFNPKEFGEVRLETEHPISQFIENYKSLNVSLGSNNMPQSIQDLFKKKSDIESELINLGIFRVINEPKDLRTGGFGVSGITLKQEGAFTLFGKQFISFIINE